MTVSYGTAPGRRRAPVTARTPWIHPGQRPGRHAADRATHEFARPLVVNGVAPMVIESETVPLPRVPHSSLTVSLAPRRPSLPTPARHARPPLWEQASVAVLVMFVVVIVVSVAALVWPDEADQVAEWLAPVTWLRWGR